MSPVIEEYLTAYALEDGQRFPLWTVLQYGVADPCAVHVTFHESESTRWVFGRDLLAAGLDRPTGVGAVQVWPVDHDQVAVRLSAVDGTLVVELPADPVRRFLRRTYASVPAGREIEPAHVESAVARILAGARDGR